MQSFTPGWIGTTTARKARPLLAVLLALLFTLGMLSRALAEGAATHAGSLTEYSTYAVGETLSDSFTLSDEWFFADPAERNDALALASMQLVATACTGDADGYSAACLRGMGFEQVGFERFGSADPDDCTYTWGTKTIQDGDESYTLVVVAIQSYAFDSETKVKGWQQNFTVNGEGEGGAEGEHYAFAKAADTVIDEIAALGGSGKVKYWVCGQSRGGALANLIAQRLPGRLGASNAGVYAYTFESPSTVDASAIADNGSYGYIHNYVCSDDIVPRIPTWDMTRYGVTHQLKTEETDAGIVAELTKLGSKAAEVEVPDGEEKMLELVAALETRIPTREDYSAVKSDSFTGADGEQVSVSYSYQQTFVNLMGAVFGGDFEGLDTNAALDHIGELAVVARSLAQAVALEEAGQPDAAVPLYWEAARELRAVLLQLTPTGETSLTVQDFYALLKLAGPIAVDTTYEPQGDDLSDTMGYLSPLIDVVMNVGSFTYSHHFDTLIARLKVLAPQPAMDNIDIAITEPAAGDSSDKAPSEVLDSIDGLGHSWLSTEASWRMADQTLEDNCVYYLDVTLRVAGYSVPDDFELTINGEAPMGEPKVTSEGGVNVIRATWRYELGKAYDVTVSFDTSGYTEAPESITVPRGTALARVEAPGLSDVRVDDWSVRRLVDWQDASGTAWSDLVVRQDTTVTATWKHVVNNIALSFDVPAIGEDFSEPTVSESAPYYVSEYRFYDEGWNEASSPSAEGEYLFVVFVKLTDPDNLVFDLESEGEWSTYMGTFSINGEELEPDQYTYEDDGDLVTADYRFTVKAQSEPTYRIVEGDGQTWTKGSATGATFKVKRSEDDDQTFGRFAGVMVDATKVDASFYDAAKGSAIISLKPAYLETLKTGKHSITAEFDDGSAQGSFAIKASDGGAGKKDAGGQSSGRLAKTGDDDLTQLLLALCGAGIVMVLSGALTQRKAG